jgi:hypothetical protein
MVRGKGINNKLPVEAINITNKLKTNTQALIFMNIK